MESDHSIGSLRTKLKALRDRIEALEGGITRSARDKRLRELVDASKRREAKILAGLSKAGIHL
jgi:hypothetical protein